MHQHDEENGQQDVATVAAEDQKETEAELFARLRAERVQETKSNNAERMALIDQKVDKLRLLLQNNRGHIGGLGFVILAAQGTSLVTRKDHEHFEGAPDATTYGVSGMICDDKNTEITIDWYWRDMYAEKNHLGKPQSGLAELLGGLQ